MTIRERAVERAKESDTPFFDVYEDGFNAGFIAAIDACAEIAVRESEEAGLAAEEYEEADDSYSADVAFGCGITANDIAKEIRALAGEG